MSKTSSKVKTSAWQKIALIVLGFVLSFVLLEIGMRLGGFVLLTLQEYENLGAMKQRGLYRILCLGESTTYRQYPLLLEKILNQSNAGTHFMVMDKGRPGTSTNAIVSGVESYLDKYHPQMVVAMMGANDHRTSYYEDIPDPRTGLFQQCRIYRLCRMLYAHFSKGRRQEDFYGLVTTNANPSSDIPKIDSSSASFSRKVLQDASAKKASVGNDHIQDAWGWEKLRQGELLQAKNFFEQAIKINSQNDDAYAGLGMFFLEMGDFSKANVHFKVAIEINHENGDAYYGLGRIRRRLGSLSEAGRFFEKAIELNPKDDNAYIALGRIYKESQNDFAKAEELFRVAIALNPRNEDAFVQLGRLYVDQDKFPQAEHLYLEAIKIAPRNEYIPVELGGVYRIRGDFAQAEVLFKSAFRINPRNERALAALASLYSNQGKSELAREYTEKLRALRLDDFDPVTGRNFHKLKAILNRRGIKLVCVQYPMRSLEPLRKIFEKDKDVVFVDNEAVFQEAVKNEGYTPYFRDLFGGDFGHCTQKGNELLAQNIAKAILREVFNK